MNLIDGRAIAASIRADLKKQVSTMTNKPGLAIILVGEDPASRTYVRLKEKAAQEIGIHVEVTRFPAETPEQKVIKKIQSLNADSNIHGIIVQLPLPEPLNTDRIVGIIDPVKDADGFLPASIEKFRTNPTAQSPVLCEGIWRLIDSTHLAPEQNKASLLANSTTFGEPMALLLTQKGLDVQISYPPFHHARELTRAADVVVIAIGQPHFLTAEDVKSGAVLIDVGYTRVDGKDVGDVDANSLRGTAGWLTPVPGGVGPMTVATLLQRTVTLCGNGKS